jgi:hypothetical protein
VEEVIDQVRQPSRLNGTLLGGPPPRGGRRAARLTWAVGNRATTRRPGGRTERSMSRSCGIEGCRRAAVWSGYATVDDAGDRRELQHGFVSSAVIVRRPLSLGPLPACAGFATRWAWDG